MATVVDTSPQANATRRGFGRKILRTSLGVLWVISPQAFSGVPRLRYSTDDGANWSTSSTAFAEGIRAEGYAAWVFCSDGAIYMVFEKADNLELRVRKGTLNGAHTDITWSAATTVDSTSALHFFDLAVHEEGGDTIVHVVYATSGTLCEYRRAVWGAAFSSATTLTTWSGNKGPKIDFHHTEADVTAVQSSTPHIYISWYEDNKIMFRKGVYSSGPSWAFNAVRTITSDALRYNGLAMSFDGTDVVMMIESLGTANALLVLERDAADTSTTSLANTPTRTGTSVAYSDVTYSPGRDIEVLHSDDGAAVLQRVTYDRSGSAWGSWATIDADADDRWPNVKVGYWSGSKADAVELIWMDSTGSPDSIFYERFEFIPTEEKTGSDSATLTELIQLIANTVGVDDATLTEAKQLLATLTGVDAATLSETSVLAVIKYIVGSLSSTLSEQAVLAIIWQLSDSATLTESSTLNKTFMTVSLDLRGSTYTYRTFPPVEAPKLVRFGRKFLSRIVVTAGVQVYAEKVSGTWQVTTHPGTRSPVAGVDWESTDGAVDNDVRVYNGGSLIVLGNTELQEVADIGDALTAAGYTVTTA